MLLSRIVRSFARFQIKAFGSWDGLIPPLTGVAVNITELPGQIGLAEAVMLTEGTANGLCVMIMIFDITVACAGHG